MARVTNEDYTILSERTLSGTGLGTSPETIAGIVDLQRAVYQDQPQDTAQAQAAADAAGTAAQGAQSSADAAQTSADSAGGRADAAQDDADAAQQRADDAYVLADGKVTKATIAPPANYSGTASATYAQSEVQALMDKVAALTTTLRAITAALKV